MIKQDKIREIGTLEATVEENKQRRGKIGDEKNVLEMQTSKGSENLMSESAYNRVTKEISDIRMLVDKKRAKGAN